MPDISMCKNWQCPLHTDCYRYCAIPSYYQTYSDFKPDDNGKCDYYWPIEKEDKDEMDK